MKVDPAESNHYFLNIALNSAAGVGFIANTNTRDLLVVDLRSGRLLHRIATPNAIAVLYNATRDEIYVTHRNDRSISVIDAKTNRVKHASKRRSCRTAGYFLPMPERVMPASSKTKNPTRSTTFSRYALSDFPCSMANMSLTWNIIRVAGQEAKPN